MGRDFISFTENIKEKAEENFFFFFTGRLALSVAVLNLNVIALAGTKFTKKSRDSYSSLNVLIRFQRLLFKYVRYSLYSQWEIGNSVKV